MKEILKDAGATDAQIEWGINLPKLSWRKEKRIRELETELKDVLVEMTAVKGVEEALKRMKTLCPGKLCQMKQNTELTRLYYWADCIDLHLGGIIDPLFGERCRSGARNHH